MKLNPHAIVYVPDGTPREAALARTDCLAISAHQDDIELMAFSPIAECFGRPDKWFTGVVVADGAGSPRNGLYADFSDEDMKTIRILEQKKAAFVGEYAAQVLLGHPSSQIKDPTDTEIVAELVGLLRATRPSRVYTHNLADKHDTHLGVVTKVIAAIRALPPDERPETLYGCEVWRDLDWLADEDKILLDTSAHPNIARSLVGVFDSQILGGKRYDLAADGRRTANATYSESHGCDTTNSVNFAMDLTPLIENDTLDIADFVAAHIEKFLRTVREKIARFAPKGDQR